MIKTIFVWFVAILLLILFSPVILLGFIWGFVDQHFWLGNEISNKLLTKYQKWIDK